SHQAQQDHQKAKQRAISTYVESKGKVEADYKEARWTINTVYEADKKVARDQIVLIQRQTKTQREDLLKRKLQAQKLVDRWDLARDLPLFLDREAAKAPGDALRMLQQACDRSRGSLQHLQDMK